MYTFKEYTNETLPFPLPFSQTKTYGTIQESQGFKTLRYIIKKDQTVVGYFQIIIFPLIKDKTSMYIPYGPVLRNVSDDLLTELGLFLKDLGNTYNTVFVRTDVSHTVPKEFPSLYRKTPLYAYKTAYHQPRGEQLLDITPEPDMLLSSMHKKTRYNINKSIKQGLETTFYFGKEILPWTDTFVVLNEQNTKSHHTTTHTKDYFKNFFDTISVSKDTFIAVTKKEGHVLAINIFVQSGDTVFCPFGASNELGKKLGAYYHIKWSSILNMRERGVQMFNWGGVSVSKNDTHLQGVTTFKSGFGGTSIVHPPLYDIVIEPLWYWLYMLRKYIKK